MMLDEFNSRIKESVTEKEYEAVEMVYMYYPTLKDMNKDDFARLYEMIGMVGITDLYKRAKELSAIDGEMAILEQRRMDLESGRS